MRQAGDAIDLQLHIRRGRRVPCICPRQHEKSPPLGDVVAFSQSRPIEHIKCSDCERTWKRINA